MTGPSQPPDRPSPSPAVGAYGVAGPLAPNSERRSGWALAALAVAFAALAVSGAALVRSSSGSPQSAPAQPTSAIAAASHDQIAAAKREACSAWRVAALAMNATRKAFIDSPARRDDPVTVMALAAAQAQAAAQVDYVRQHVPAATPHEVAAAISDYLDAVIDTAAADGQAGADAAANAGRAALLVAAFVGAPQQLLPATADRLHQQYRAPAMPASAELVAALRATGLPAVISGAGPTVLVLARDDLEVERAQAMTPPGWRALALPVLARGGQVVAADS